MKQDAGTLCSVPCLQVDVFNPANQRTYSFPCNAWLEASKEEGVDGCRKELLSGEAGAGGGCVEGGRGAFSMAHAGSHCVVRGGNWVRDVDGCRRELLSGGAGLCLSESTEWVLSESTKVLCYAVRWVRVGMLRSLHSAAWVRPRSLHAAEGGR